MASSQANREAGVQTEQFRAEARGRTAEHVGTGGWYDVDDDGTPVEVKSCQRTVAVNYGDNDRVRPGRYQIDHDNHRNLVDHGGEYDFVLMDENGDSSLDVVTIDAADLDDLINELNRTWPDSPSKLKLRWQDVHDEDEVDR